MNMINKMWDDFPEIKDDLIRCRKYIIENIEIPNKEVEKCVLNLVNENAKLVRPALMVLVGKILNKGRPLDDDFIAMTATIEMLHMATLIHDDIVDDSPIRRGIETVQSKFGKDVATYAGDYMLSSVFSNVLNYSKTISNARLITDSVSDILAGELIQMENRNNLYISEDEYMKIIYGKTAIMIALSCYEGGYMVGDENGARLAWDLGESIGMAFQIIDDILDYSDIEMTKKPVFQDFKEGNFTLPAIFSMNNEEDVDRVRLQDLRKRLIDLDENKKIISKESLDSIVSKKVETLFDKEKILENEQYESELTSINIEIKKIIEDNGGIDYSIQKARYYTDKAVGILETYNDCIYKTYLRKLVMKLLDRRY